MDWKEGAMAQLKRSSCRSVSPAFYFNYL